jgi:hypothetical protein
MHPHTLSALGRAILQDLRAGQSTADSTAQRLKIDKQTAERICQALLTEKQVDTFLIADFLTVYRITPKGLEIIS